MVVFFIRRGLDLPGRRIAFRSHREQKHERNLPCEREKLAQQICRSRIAPVHIVEDQHGGLEREARFPPQNHRFVQLTLESLVVHGQGLRFGLQAKQGFEDTQGTGMPCFVLVLEQGA